MQSLVQEQIQKKEIDEIAILSLNDDLVSCIQEIPDYLKEAMSAFIDKYPNWDQYRLMQAALAGFLIQNGVRSREITRSYVDNMFDSSSLLEGNRN